MSKKSIRLIVVALILVVGVVAYKFIPKGESSATEETTASTTVMLVDRQTSDLQSFSTTGKDFEYTYTQKDSVWTYNDPNIPVISDDISGIALYVASLSSVRTLGEVSSLADYGLDDPLIVKGVFTDNSTVTIKVGMKAPTGDAYYVMREGDNNVYTVSKYTGDQLTKKLSSVRVTTFETFDTTQIVDEFILKHRGAADIEIVKNTESDITKELATAVNVMVKPYEKPRGVSTDVFTSDYLSPLSTIAISEFVEDNPDDLSKYGLDEPLLDISITIPNPEEGVLADETTPRVSLHFQFGGDATDDTVYFKEADKPYIYTTKRSNIEEYLNSTSFSLSDKFIALVNIQIVDKFTIETSSGIDAYEIKRVTIPGTLQSDGTTSEDEVESTYFLNGKEVHETLFKEVYKGAIGLVGEVDLPKDVYDNVSDTPYITVKYYLNNGESDIVAKIIPYKNDFYIGGKNDNYMYAIGSRQVEYLVKCIEAIK